MTRLGQSRYYFEELFSVIRHCVTASRLSFTASRHGVTSRRHVSLKRRVVDVDKASISEACATRLNLNARSLSFECEMSGMRVIY